MNKKPIKDLTFEEFRWNIINEIKSPYSNKVKIIFKSIFNFIFLSPFILFWLIMIPISILELLVFFINNFMNFVERIEEKYLFFVHKINPFRKIFSDEFYDQADICYKKRIRGEE